MLPMIASLVISWFALQVTAAPKPLETRHLSITVSTGSIVSGKLPLHVDVTPRPTMHVYAPGQPGYIGITLTLDADAPVKVSGKPKYPAPRKFFMPVLNETQLVYSTTFRLTQDVTIPRTAAPGPLTITGTLRYQACDDTICYKPVTVPVSWTIGEREAPVIR
jgi:DsbC/DsbD-like thiol-disulfide interchange protein